MSELSANSLKVFWNVTLVSECDLKFYIALKVPKKSFTILFNSIIEGKILIKQQ